MLWTVYQPRAHILLSALKQAHTDGNTPPLRRARATGPAIRNSVIHDVASAPKWRGYRPWTPFRFSPSPAHNRMCYRQRNSAINKRPSGKTVAPAFARAQPHSKQSKTKITYIQAHATSTEKLHLEFGFTRCPPRLKGGNAHRTGGGRFYAANMRPTSRQKRHSSSPVNIVSSASRCVSHTTQFRIPRSARRPYNTLNNHPPKFTLRKMGLCPSTLLKYPCMCC